MDTTTFIPTNGTTPIMTQETAGSIPTQATTIPNPTQENPTPIPTPLSTPIEFPIEGPSLTMGESVTTNMTTPSITQGIRAKDTRTPNIPQKDALSGTLFVMFISSP